MDFQSVLQVPAVQLVNKPGIFKKYSQGKNKLVVASASSWLRLLP